MNRFRKWFTKWLNTPPMREIWEKDPIRPDCSNEEAMGIFATERLIRLTRRQPDRYGWIMRPVTQLNPMLIGGHYVDSEAVCLSLLCIGFTLSATIWKWAV